MIDLFKRAKVIPFTKYLSQKYPGKWKYNRRGRQWEHEDGIRVVWACAKLAPRYDGDDDNFMTEYWLYYIDTDKSPERVC